MDSKTTKRGLFQSTKALKKNLEKQSTRWDQSNLLNNAMAPMLCTAYAVNLEATTLYEGSEEAKQVVGPESPFRFDKINDYRILVDSEIFGPDTKEEYGWQIDSSLNINMYPGSVNLEDKSILVLHSMPGVYFNLTNSNLARVMPNTYSQAQIAVTFTDRDIESVKWLEKQVVNEYTLTKYNQGSFVMTNKSIEKRNTLFDIQEDILETFLAMYYQDDIGGISYRYSIESGNVLVYDPYATRFITKNAVTSARGCKIFKLVNDSEVKKDVDFDLKYNKSFFGRLERKKDIAKDLSYKLYGYKKYEKLTTWSRFHELKLDYTVMVVTRDTEAPITELIDYECTHINDPNNSSLDNIIGTYLHTSIDDMKTEMFDFLDDFYEERSYSTMVKLLMCMYILEQKIDSIHGRNIDSNIIKEVQ